MPEIGAKGAEGLLGRISRCTICADLPLGPRPVVQLDPAARILIAGQAPGRKVHETGVPFNDPSGERLRDWMGIGADVFYDPAQIAILPMGFCYPGTGAGGDLPPRPECAPHWRQQAMDHLTNLRLTLVIGRYAMGWHLEPPKSATLTDIVRNWRQAPPGVMPLPHPSPRNNRWLARNPWFVAEIVPELKRRVQGALND